MSGSLERLPIGEPLSRRAALKRLGIAAGAAALQRCTPLRLAFGLYPAQDDRAADRVLRAFVVTVIPGAPPEDPNLTRVFFDPFYPFAPYRSWLVWDLDRRARALTGGTSYPDLDLGRRADVVQDALVAGDGTTARLYQGAIFLAQAAVYAGIYDDELGCPLIDFHGASGLLPLEAQTYPAPGRFLPAADTADGNPT